MGTEFPRTPEDGTAVVGGIDLGTADLTLERATPTLAEITADKLREFILLEKLPAGAAINERDLASALGISRTPLRAALAMLEREGLIEYSVTRRPRVADPSIDEIARDLVVMGALEALAGELACAAARDDQIARVATLDRNMREGTGILEPLEFFRTDMEMHTTIVKASANASLIETHRQYNARLWRARFLSSRRSAGREVTLAEHGAIAEAIVRRDPKAAGAALRSHLDSTVRNISFAFRDRGATNPERIS